MSSAVLSNAEDQVRTRRRRSTRDVGEPLDDSTAPNNSSGADAVPRASRTTGTRKRSRTRLGKDIHDTFDHETVPEAHNEGTVWLDGPLALTLLPPLGSFLTGGDFIRDGLILALLFYYLRALIKTPWELYLKARARRPPPILEVPDDDETEPEYISAVRTAARSELRLAELAYLGLCLLTPFLGVVLLRYGASLLSADGTITWFSTGLFVLTTGVRPWRHLIQLLVTRTDSLHDIVHHPHVHTPTQKQSLKDQHDVAIAVQEQSEESRAALHQTNARLDGLESVLEEIRLNAAASQNQSVSISTHLEQTIAAWPAQIDALKATTSRIESSLDDLSTTIRNTSRAHEVLRLESDERASEYQKALDALVGEVDQLHKRVATAATTAAAANATAQAASASAGAAQAAVMESSKSGTVITRIDTSSGNGIKNGAANGKGSSPKTGDSGYPLTPSNSAGNNLNQSLAWTPPKGEGIDPWGAGVTDPALAAALGRINAASSSFAVGGPGIQTRTRSGSTSRARNRSTSRSFGPNSPNGGNGFTLHIPSPFAKLLAWADPPAQANASFAQIIVHYVVQVMLVPVTLSQGLLHRVVGALGVAAEPTAVPISLGSPRGGVAVGGASGAKKAH